MLQRDICQKKKKERDTKSFQMAQMKKLHHFSLRSEMLIAAINHRTHNSWSLRPFHP